MDIIRDFITTHLHLSEKLDRYIEFGFYCIIFLFLVSLLNYITKSILTFVLRRANKFNNINLIKYALQNKLPKYLAMLLPYAFLVTFVPIIFSDYPKFVVIMDKILGVCIIFLIIWIILACVKIAINLLQERPAFSNKPMKSYTQVVSIIIYSLGFIVMFAILTNQSVGTILAGLGAVSAITMLVFQDSIKGFVGSIQMTTNNMVELGNWITVPKYNADGTVEEINLTTVKIRNFDNTVTTVPTYSLISDSFQNWQAMSRSGGRRIKRNLFIKQSSIKKVALDKLNVYRNNLFLKSYLNKHLENHQSEDIYITNNDLFMNYALAYLQQHKDINHNMTCMVRQLAPTTTGLPVEIYTFTTTEWIVYERVASEIINHLISVVNEFELELFEGISDSYQLNN